jgi:small subunit ribosomal protein S18
VAEDFENEDEIEEEVEVDDSDLGGEESGSGPTRSGADFSERRGSRGGPRGRFGRRPRVCQFCSDKTKTINYRQTDVLRRFVTDQGKIRGRRETGTCARHQRMVARAIKRARHMALLSYTGESRR